jgi:murein peptide amidase A
VQPRFLTSLHQPFGEVGRDKDKPMGFQRRLAGELRLPLRKIDIGGATQISHEPGLQPGGRNNAPTLTGWYNAHYPGSAITVEYTAHPSPGYVTAFAGHGIIRASWADR